MSDGFRETEPETENKTEEMLRRSRFALILRFLVAVCRSVLCFCFSRFVAEQMGQLMNVSFFQSCWG